LQNFSRVETSIWHLQRGSLVPVPDSMQYKDQLDEINTLTAKITRWRKCWCARVLSGRRR
jgi:hypothetical protein